MWGRRWERLKVCVCASVCENQKSRQSSQSHSFRSIRFSESQSVRQLTDIPGFSSGTHALRVSNKQKEMGAGSCFLGWGEHQQNKSNSGRNDSAAAENNLCCSLGVKKHFLNRHSSPKGQVSREELFSAKNQSLADRTTKKVPELCYCSAQMRHLILLLSIEGEKQWPLFPFLSSVSFYTEQKLLLHLYPSVLNRH